VLYVRRGAERRRISLKPLIAFALEKDCALLVCHARPSKGERLPAATARGSTIAPSALEEQWGAN
jgi:hypothetical protein